MTRPSRPLVAASRPRVSAPRVERDERAAPKATNRPAKAKRREAEQRPVAERQPMQDLRALDPPRLPRGIATPAAPTALARPAAAVVPPDEPSSVQGGFAALLLGALAIAAVLLGLSSIPTWVVHSARMAGLLEQWRAQIAAAGLSTLAAAGIVFVLSQWKP